MFDFDRSSSSKENPPEQTMQTCASAKFWAGCHRKSVHLKRVAPDAALPPHDFPKKRRRIPNNPKRKDPRPSLARASRLQHRRTPTPRRERACRACDQRCTAPNSSGSTTDLANCRPTASLDARMRVLSWDREGVKSSPGAHYRERGSSEGGRGKHARQEESSRGILFRQP